MLKNKTLKLLLVFMLLVMFLPGCTVETEYEPQNITYESGVTLRVLVDSNQTLPFFNLHEKVRKTFKEQYAGVEIEVLTIPEDSLDAVLFIQQIRQEIQEGRGPDLYLLSTNGDSRTLLFPDVNQAMRQGAFLNLNGFYEFDNALEKDGLQKIVMDAGMVDGFQYTLPLEYDYPTVAFSPSRLEEAGIDPGLFEDGIVSAMNTVADYGDTYLAFELCEIPYHKTFNFFPQILDYDGQEVTANREELIDYAKAKVRMYCLQVWPNNNEKTGSMELSFGMYRDKQTWQQLGGYLRVQNQLSEVLQETVYSDLEKLDMEIVPLTGPSGEVVAEVSLFGAIDVNCKNPELAYQYLREFLTENGQWMRELGTRETGDLFWTRYSTLSYGYPVRTEDSVGPVFRAIRGRIPPHSSIITAVSPEAAKAFLELDIKDKDVPVLQTEIDVARYPIANLERKLNSDLNSQAAACGYDPDEVDVEAIVDDLLNELQCHVFNNG